MEIKTNVVKRKYTAWVTAANGTHFFYDHILAESEEKARMIAMSIANDCGGILEKVVLAEEQEVDP